MTNAGVTGLCADPVEEEGVRGDGVGEVAGDLLS